MAPPWSNDRVHLQQLLNLESVKVRRLGFSRDTSSPSHHPECGAARLMLVCFLSSSLSLRARPDCVLICDPHPAIKPLSAQKTQVFVMHKAKEIMGKSSSKHTFFTDQEFHDLVESTNSTGPGIRNIWFLVCIAAAANIPK